MEVLKGKELFVLGHARSGTTILGRLLNSSEEVMLLGEAHLFESYWNPNFVTNFNFHHQRTKKVKSKGTHLPSQFAGMLPEAILKKLSEHYRWVGEKIAIGPMAGLGSRAASHALDYYQAYHLDADYILSFRAPASSLESLRKLFPKVSLTALLQGWMFSFIEIGAASNILKNVSLAPLELMSIEYWDRIQQKMGITGRADSNWLNPDAGKAASATVRKTLHRQLASELEWDEKQAQQFFERLTELYARFIELIDPQTMYFVHSVSFADTIAQKLLGEVQDMAAQLNPPPSSSHVIPSSTCAWLKKDKLISERRALPLPGERLLRFSAVLRDSLFSGSAATQFLNDKNPYPLLAEGMDLQREGGWLRLQAKTDLGTDSHKHMTVRAPIEPMTVSTIRFRVRREPGNSRYLMLQVGDAKGFYKSVFDCQQQEVMSILATDSVKCIFSHIELVANGEFRISVSGMLVDGSDSYLRIYLCDDTGAIEFLDTDARLMISDLVLSYSHQDSGLDEVI